MPSRNRSRSLAGFYGNYERWLFGSYFLTSHRTTAPLLVETCSDTVGQRDVSNPFYLTRTSREYALINGEEGQPYNPNSTGYIYRNYPMNGGGEPNLDHLSVTLPSADVANILARSNPNRPSVSLPVFVAELKDLPGLIRFVGRSTIQHARNLVRDGKATLAEANVAYQFGMAPLYSDLAKMFDFSDLVERKRNQLERLHSKGGLKRRITVGEASAQHDNAPGLMEGTPEIHGFFRKKTTGRRWATVRWRPVYTSIPSASQLDREAWMSTFGMHLSLADFWELLPWSWLIDYFTNIGDLLSAHRGGIPVEYSDVCVMTHMRTTMECVVTRVVPRGVIVQGTTIRTVESKARAPVSSSIILPSAKLPFLGAGQLSILASLSILKTR